MNQSTSMMIDRSIGAFEPWGHKQDRNTLNCRFCGFTLEWAQWGWRTTCTGYVPVSRTGSLFLSLIGQDLKRAIKMGTIKSLIRLNILAQRKATVEAMERLKAEKALTKPIIEKASEMPKEEAPK